MIREAIAKVIEKKNLTEAEMVSTFDEIIRGVRKLEGDTPIIIGGIYATLCPEHAQSHTGADIIYKGRVENGFESVIKAPIWAGLAAPLIISSNVLTISASVRFFFSMTFAIASLIISNPSP